MSKEAHKYYCVIDVETTGKGLGGNRITEICAVRMRDNIVIDKFTMLVNPERLIPPFITSLTGIDDEMVYTAPLFSEIAQELLTITKDAIFVAHNVGFDFNVIRNEFKRIGMDFTRKKLCTVRLSRILIPNMPSYSLGRLCSNLKIRLDNRHRAEGDTDATVLLFKRLLAIDVDYVEMNKFMNGGSKEGTFPPHLDRSQFDKLPDAPGVYIFKNQAHKVIYVGKAINLKKRVLSHFYSKKSKSYLMCQEIYHIEHEPTGNELVALLLEADLIRHYYPKFNSAQKKPRATYQILHYKNQIGVIQLAVGLVKSYDHRVMTFYNRAQAVEMLSKLCEDFKLCPKYCGLQKNVTECSHFQIKNCEGICRKEELVDSYNSKVIEALEYVNEHNPTYAFKLKGRTVDEQCFVLIQDGEYSGYGYVSYDDAVATVADCERLIEFKKGNYHTNQIIKSFMNKAPSSVIVNFDNQQFQAVS